MKWYYDLKSQGTTATEQYFRKHSPCTCIMIFIDHGKAMIFISSMDTVDFKKSYYIEKENIGSTTNYAICARLNLLKNKYKYAIYYSQQVFCDYITDNIK